MRMGGFPVLVPVAYKQQQITRRFCLTSVGMAGAARNVTCDGVRRSENFRRLAAGRAVVHFENGLR